MGLMYMKSLIKEGEEFQNKKSKKVKKRILKRGLKHSLTTTEGLNLTMKSENLSEVSVP